MTGYKVGDIVISGVSGLFYEIAEVIPGGYTCKGSDFSVDILHDRLRPATPLEIFIVKTEDMNAT